MEEGGDVLIYSPGAQPIYGYGTDFLPPRLISVVKNQGEDSDENGIAKIGGTPCWLQDEEFTPGMSYVLQINSSRLNKAVPSHKGILVGGIGTLLLGRLDGEVQGRFIVQTT
ncbi:hypothetical protein C4Q28_18140 [Pseudomonas sp. SWI6]|nr:hypothetical protein C4Q28_18140 [Pseudomonas sp. SWI6]